MTVREVVGLQERKLKGSRVLKMARKIIFRANKIIFPKAPKNNFSHFKKYSMCNNGQKRQMFVSWECHNFFHNCSFNESLYIVDLQSNLVLGRKMDFQPSLI